MTRILFVFFFASYTFTAVAQSPLEQEIRNCEQQISSWQDSLKNYRNTLIELKLKQTGKEIAERMLPRTSDSANTVFHSAMALSYNEKHEQANWVAHIIRPEIINGKQSRTNDFRTDPKVKTLTAVKADYWYSGFDRGHLAPSADFKWSKSALSESYFYSNMSPQRPELNREGWAELESTLREYVYHKKRPLYVYTGPVLKDGLQSIGKENKVSVPEQYYKIAYDISGDTLRAIGFLFPNGNCPNPTLSYAESVDEIEKLTGIDFFPSLPDSIENKIEAQLEPQAWQTGLRKGNVLPIHRNKLPKGVVNTVMAQSYYDKKTTVCGTVVSVKETKSGNYFINFDQKFPNQLFWVSIWKSERVNFSYDIEETLINQKVCVKGIVKEKYGKPSMSIRHDRAIRFYEDEIK